MTEAAESAPAVADLLARARVYVEDSHAKQTLERTPPTGNISAPGVRSTSAGRCPRHPRRSSATWWRRLTLIESRRWIGGWPVSATTTSRQARPADEGP